MRLGRVLAAAACAGLLAACSTPASEPATAPSSPSGSSANASAIPAAPSASASPVAAAGPAGFTIQTQSRTDLQKYSQFTYMTATTTGLAPEAAATADERIKGMVDSAVNAALAGDDGECMEGETKCGIFEQTLTVLPCADQFICLKQDVNGVPVGSATSNQGVDVLVLDPATGRAVDLTSFVPRKATKKFLAAVNAEVASAQEQAGFYDPTYPPELTQEDFSGWAPLTDRIQIWFSRYAAGPGAMGAVTVAVPYPSDIAAATTAPTPAGIVTSWQGLYDYFCDRNPENLPKLVDSSADPFATSVLQMLLNSWQYNAGPVDGRFGPSTQKAVRAFQRDWNLTVDGLVGPQTWRAFDPVCECEGPTC